MYGHFKDFDIPACKRTIFYMEKPYFVSFPDLIFRLNFETISRNVEGFCRFKSLQVRLAESEELLPLLPNIQTNGHICLPIRFSNILPVHIEAPTVNQLFDLAMDAFWKSNFSAHFYIVAAQYRADYQNLFEDNLKEGKIRNISTKCHFYAGHESNRQPIIQVFTVLPEHE